MIDYRRKELIRDASLVIIVILIVSFMVIVSAKSQDDKTPIAITPKSSANQPPKTISLNAQEKQPFVDIMSRFDAALTKKQLAEREMEIEQLKLRIAVEEVKKAKGCGDCQFDMGKLELVMVEKPKEEKKEVKP